MEPENVCSQIVRGPQEHRKKPIWRSYNKANGQDS